MNHEEKAKELFYGGCNCAQAVFCAFCDEMKIDEKTAMRLSSSFGGGVSRLREICGAVSAMALTAGYLYGYDDPCAREEKAEHYKRVQFMAEEFKQKCGSIVCRELLKLRQEGASDPVPEERTGEYYKRRAGCVKCVGAAAAITEKLIENNGDVK